MCSADKGRWGRIGWGGRRGWLFVMIYGEGYCENQNGQTSRRYLIRAPPKLPLKGLSHSRLSRTVLPCTLCGSHDSFPPPPPLMNFFVRLFVSVCRDKFFPEGLSGYGGTKLSTVRGNGPLGAAVRRTYFDKWAVVLVCVPTVLPCSTPPRPAVVFTLSIPLDLH